ncbi:MAG: 2-dehydro-3-deoxygalactonokinase [Polaromonas sp.]|jgi:2-dehydro-3-deoxygalactonokinase|nr:2-dehydro-3-deoxygalactonokinase [Polaromonas sp.]MDB5937704.1 2-dehydro-3-deoxygalactonokinase [Polaromonas sp.]
MKPLLALDWGTTSLRGALLAADGTVVQERALPQGILSVAAGQFPSVFQNAFGDWMQDGRLCLIAGMAGSQQGWREAPYCACPAGFGDIAARLAWVEPGRIAIVPGLSIEAGGVPDVMRGEETQVFGALALLGLDDARLVLPGTHSKWVNVGGRRITHFSTWMSGEFYALLRRHSILARTLPDAEPPHDADAFMQGVQHARQGAGLLHTAFSTRTLSLFRRLPAEALPSYLSGLVIGEEVKAQSLARGDSVVVIGAPALAACYEQALALWGVAVQPVGNQATWRGLHAIAETLNSP